MTRIHESLGSINKSDSTIDSQVGAPEIAVVISCRNYDSFVTHAIYSVARQTYTRLRCVIVDDASTDDSLRTIERTLAKLGDPRFSVLPMSENVGQLKAYQLALANTPSHFVAFHGGMESKFAV